MTDIKGTDTENILSLVNSDPQFVSVFNKISAKRPILTKIFSQFGNYTLDAYQQTFCHENSSSIQPRSECIEVIATKTARLLGSRSAKKLRKELENNPVLLTGNHHCPDFLPMTLQGSILFALSKRKEAVIPIIACADIPLNNADYPRGIITASGIKINIYPDKDKHRLVSCTPPFSRQMLDKACQKVLALHDQKKITGWEKNILLDILQKDYGSNSVLRQKSYSHQIAILNKKLWNRIFAPLARKRMPDVVFLEMEEIVSTLLQKDMCKKGTFFSEIFFNPTLRANILRELNGIYGCWELERLAMLQSGQHTYEEKQLLMKHVGTAFFWGIDQKGRRYSLQIMEAEGGVTLQGRDDSDGLHTFLFTPEHLASYLQEKSLLPSLFTSYASLSFVRGFKCYGGFMQTDYLTAMKHGLIRTLRKSGYDEWANNILFVPTENYITSIIYALTTQQDNYLYPAGALEFMKNGGLTEKDIEKIKKITLTEGMLFSIQTMYNTLFEDKIDAVWLQKVLNTMGREAQKKFLHID